MAKAQALLVGLKSVDPDAYNNWDGTAGCWGCELDVDNMDILLQPLGYQTKTLKTAEATRDNILASLYRASETLVDGDIFVFYYSGHGGQQPDANGDEVDGKDETLVAYDREVIDDKIHYALSRFEEGVRLVMISDSCNSGTNYKSIKTISVNENTIFRPFSQKSVSRSTEMKAELIHFGGCRDGFGSSGYQNGGAFTMALCEAWQNGAFSGTFKELHTKLCAVITSSQKPQYNEYGNMTEIFKNQRAFEVSITHPVEDIIELPVNDVAIIKAEISLPGEKDQYKFKVQEEGTYSIETEGRTDLIMTLYGPDDENKLIKSDDDSGSNRNPKIAEYLKQGVYYTRIEHYDNTNGTGTYTIKVTKES